MFGLTKSEQYAFHRAYARYNERAARRGHSFNLDKAAFLAIMSSNCAYCGVAPSREWRGKGKHNDCVWVAGGIDRVDSRYGYRVDNVTPCCTSCNTRKGTMSQDDFINSLAQ